MKLKLQTDCVLHLPHSKIDECESPFGTHSILLELNIPNPPRSACNPTHPYNPYGILCFRVYGSYPELFAFHNSLAHCLDPNTRKTPPIYAIFGGNKYKPVIINQGNYLLRLIPSDVINMYALYRREQ